ncbi:hypothetical protein FHG87_012349 [Trinorchestia longiramus]|nr:hypothetical protein FHG87_012349 [Trinorchestia longiramus]
MLNKYGVVNCPVNYNKENRRRVFRLSKEQSERQKWLDVIPPRENFFVDSGKFFICEIHWGSDPYLIKLHGGSMRLEIPPSIFNVPASCLPSPKPAPRPAKVEDQQLRYFLQKDKITSFDAFKPERNLQKQYKNLIISRSKESLVCLFITDYFKTGTLLAKNGVVVLSREGTTFYLVVVSHHAGNMEGITGTTGTTRTTGTTKTTKTTRITRATTATSSTTTSTTTTTTTSSSWKRERERERARFATHKDYLIRFQLSTK